MLATWLNNAELQGNETEDKLAIEKAAEAAALPQDARVVTVQDVGQSQFARRSALSKGCEDVTFCNTDRQDPQPNQTSTRIEVPDWSTVQQRIQDSNKTKDELFHLERNKVGIAKTNGYECEVEKVKTTTVGSAGNKLLGFRWSPESELFTGSIALIREVNLQLHPRQLQQRR